MKIYLAGPLGFTESGRAFHKANIIPKIQALGFEILDPWTLTDEAAIREVQSIRCEVERKRAWQTLSFTMGENNHRAIDASSLLFAVLDGADVDSGTAAEIGYAFAAGKPILGYRSDLRQSGENEGVSINLQVEYFIRKSGGQIITQLDALGDALSQTTLRALV